MHPDVTAIKMIIHQKQANDFAETLREADHKGMVRPSIEKVTQGVNDQGYEATEPEVERALRNVYGPRPEDDEAA